MLSIFDLEKKTICMIEIYKSFAFGPKTKTPLVMLQKWFVLQLVYTDTLNIWTDRYSNNDIGEQDTHKAQID